MEASCERLSSERSCSASSCFLRSASAWRLSSSMRPDTAAIDASIPARSASCRGSWAASFCNSSHSNIRFLAASCSARSAWSFPASLPCSASAATIDSQYATRSSSSAIRRRRTSGSASSANTRDASGSGTSTAPSAYRPSLALAAISLSRCSSAPASSTRTPSSPTGKPSRSGLSNPAKDSTSDGERSRRSTDTSARSRCARLARSLDARWRCASRFSSACGRVARPASASCRSSPCNAFSRFPIAARSMSSTKSERRFWRSRIRRISPSIKPRASDNSRSSRRRSSASLPKAASRARAASAAAPSPAVLCPCNRTKSSRFALRSDQRNDNSRSNSPRRSYESTSPCT